MTLSTDALPAWAALQALPLSPRVAALQAAFTAAYTAWGRRIFWNDALADARDRAILAAYRATAGAPAITRRAAALQRIADTLPLAVSPDALLLGDQTVNRPWWCSAPEVRDTLSALGYGRTGGHIVHDYAVLLRAGIPGLAASIDASRAAHAGDAEAGIVLDAFSTALAAFRRYLERIADAAESAGHPAHATVRALTTAPPQSFAQALQLLWAAHIFLHLENPSVAISFGRMDQYLWPFLAADLAAGRIDVDTAFELVGALLLKCCEGEESQNAVLGGVTPDGDDATNPLSLLVLAAMARLQTFQPSLVVRLHPASPPAFVEAACALATVGTGNPGFMNDPVVIAGLEALGIPPERARDWGVVGCYEATTQGDCYPNTVLGQLHLVRALSAYLATPEAQAAATFEAFTEGWFTHLRQIYVFETLAACRQAWDFMAEAAPSPFGSLLMSPCVARAQPLETGGARFSLAGINILGLGTVVDSLHAIRTLIFEQPQLTLPALAAAVAADFPEEALRGQLLRMPGRYGTDAPATNALAAEISTRIARMVLDSRMDHGVRPYPGFFAFSADIYATDLPSPDGRRRGELISYGVAPTATVATGPTAVLASAAQVAHGLAACGNPLALSLARRDLSGAAGVARIRALVETYFALGGSHLHCNAVDAATLREAQATPAQHASLTVRVSGYSARFVTVDARWQDALIERAEQGL